MKYRRSLLSVLLALVLVFSAMPLMAIADSGETGANESITYDYTDEYSSYTLTQNDDSEDTYSLFVGPGSYDPCVIYSVTLYQGMDPDQRMDLHERITRIEIAEGVEELGDYCFSSFSALRYVTLPSTLNKIGKGAFKGCRCLQEIDIPDSVTFIGESAFDDTCLIPDAVSLPRGCNAYNDDYETAKIFYDVHDDGSVSVSPDAPQGTTYTDQFRDTYGKITEILADLGVDSMTRDIDKIRAIYDWITSNVEYDYTALDYRYNQSEYGRRRYSYAATAHSCLFAHMGICSGYADITKTMLKEAGIRCLECFGQSDEGDDHAWVLIEVNGIWYAADSTWDAGKSPSEYMYFLMPYKYFEDHVWDMEDSFYEVYPIKDPEYGRAVSGAFECYVYTDSAILTKYNGSASAVTLPETVEYDGAVYPVTRIANYAFKGNKTLKTVVVPEGFEAVGYGVFHECPALSKVTLPLSLKGISYAIDYNSNVVFYIDGTYAQVKESPLLKSVLSNCYADYVMCKDKKILNPYMIHNAKFSISRKSFVYNGKVQKPVLKVTDAFGKVLKSGIDYEASVTGDDDVPRNVDEYYFCVDGLGDYGMESIEGVGTFRIYPQPTTIKKVKAAKKSMTVTWTKKTAQVGGYQIQYALNSSFTKGRKTVTVKKNSISSIKIKKLKSKKKYYVRIRTFKYAPYLEENLYSTWSKAKKIKVK